MRRSIILLLCALILPVNFLILSAQTSPNRRMNMEDYEKRKREYVTKEADLTQEEAAKYFPLSNELMQKKFKLYRSHREKVQRIKDNSDISEKEYRKMLEDDVDVKLKEAALDKEYSAKFEKVLPPEKLYKAQQAEKDFIQREVSNFRREGRRR
jgi:Spy/CpxP family protein refolding chaperone